MHDLHVWSVTSGAVAPSGHLAVPDLTRHPAALAGLKQAVADECLGVDYLEPLGTTEVAAQHHGHRR